MARTSSMPDSILLYIFWAFACYSVTSTRLDCSILPMYVSACSMRTASAATSADDAVENETLHNIPLHH